MHRRILAGNALAAGAATLAAPGIASAQPKVRWRCPGSFPKSLDTLYGTQEFIARRVAEDSLGNFLEAMTARG